MASKDFWFLPKSLINGTDGFSSKFNRRHSENKNFVYKKKIRRQSYRLRQTGSRQLFFQKNITDSRVNMGKSARIPFIGRKYQRIWIRWENRRPLRALGARQLLARRDFCKIEGLRSTLKKPPKVATMASKNQFGSRRSIGIIKTNTTIAIWARNLQIFESHFLTVSFWHEKSDIEKPN